ncbi:tRNA (adenine-N(1)-)-methyltransferase catalytic subunit trm61 [Trapelia coarctata]|nr:tRNA (adenine-N(1)-)-methyltransferase catalytic subunit trm61 [Trapelia coarctata]
MASSSTFLTPGLFAEPDSLALLHLKRDLEIPVILRSSDDQNEGYSEGKVTNTRFGSFPHSTLIGVPWGSQVRASAVDTGSRGRKRKNKPENSSQLSPGKKRKLEPESAENVNEIVNDGAGDAARKEAVVASTGFIYLLPPTPESWTLSLPHRTQVVYTPDYSYILQRLRVRPGSVVIEAGAGSGSFTHAAARAVFNGYPTPSPEAAPTSAQPRPPTRQGKVWSFEFHEPRFQKLKTEIHEHGLSSTVEITHRDVCADGFSVLQNSTQAVQADTIFLDLPAPWLALRHLTRAQSTPPLAENEMHTQDPLPQSLSENNSNILPPSALPASSTTNTCNPLPSLPSLPSPLSPSRPIRICTFSPCIEQVQRTVSTLRSLSYTSIETVELSAKRIETRRERVGIAEEGLRGVNASPASVAEAVSKLREVEGRTRAFHGVDAASPQAKIIAEAEAEVDSPAPTTQGGSKQIRPAAIVRCQATRKIYKEGRLIHRPEPELKTHTSYLVFAILPREWSVENEARAQAKWGSGTVVTEGLGRGKEKSRRQMKREGKAAGVGGTEGKGGGEGAMEVRGGG